jgi:tetratricopeptide (TPR) repeat protein
MVTDADGLTLSTTSDAARDAYVRGLDLQLRFYPGDIAALNQATEADPGFAMAHILKAQIYGRQGNGPATREAMAAAKSAATGLSDREASHLAFFDQLISGQIPRAIETLYDHMDKWPRDRLVISTACNPNGLIGNSGQIGQKHRIAELMDRLAPNYGDDAWFLAHHAMALSEDGRLKEARPKIERAVAEKRDNAHAAHAYAHLCYESGDAESARTFFSAWLPEYPRDGFFRGHLSWHWALVELEVGNIEGARHLYEDAFCLTSHSGGPQQKMTDATAFLWRAELAGAPRDSAAWQTMHEFARANLLSPRNGLEDVHVVLAQAVMRDQAGMAARVQQMQDLTQQGRYMPGSYLPTLAHAFAAFEQGDYDKAIEVLEPSVSESERIGGSRAQHDLVGFTLLKAYLLANRPEDARQFLTARRPGKTSVPVAEASVLH